jgi:hypothetical protein
LSDLTWIDYTRRNDPACLAGLERFKEMLLFHGYPQVLCFWTKAPTTLAYLYEDVIRDLQDHNTLVLAQVTQNFYGEDMEPGIRPQDLGPLVTLISCKAIRLRFDPIILGYTKPSHFQNCVEVAKKHRVDRITVNFLVPEYKNVGALLKEKGFNIEAPSKQRKISTVGAMGSMAGDIEIAICAETAGMIAEFPWLKPAACADPKWAIDLQPDLKFTHTERGSRPGCGCVYSGDWGEYRNRGGYACPHQCLYCYAK